MTDKYNAILQVNPDQKSGKGKLAGKKIAVKANINVKGLNANCASKVLENYKSPYDATVVEKIKNQGAIITGIAAVSGVCFRDRKMAVPSMSGSCRPSRRPGSSSSGPPVAPRSGCPTATAAHRSWSGRCSRRRRRSPARPAACPGRARPPTGCGVAPARDRGHSRSRSAGLIFPDLFLGVRIYPSLCGSYIGN